MTRTARNLTSRLTAAVSDGQRCQPDQRGQPRVAAGRLVQVVHAQPARQVGMARAAGCQRLGKRRADRVEQPRPRQAPPGSRLALAIAPDGALAQIGGQRDDLHGRQQQPQNDSRRPGRQARAGDYAIR